MRRKRRQERSDLALATVRVKCGERLLGPSGLGRQRMRQRGQRLPFFSLEPHATRLIEKHQQLVNTPHDGERAEHGLSPFWMVTPRLTAEDLLRHALPRAQAVIGDAPRETHLGSLSMDTAAIVRAEIGAHLAVCFADGKERRAVEGEGDTTQRRAARAVRAHR